LTCELWPKISRKRIGAAKEELAMPDVKRRRTANNECSVARAVNLVGDRWTILLLREAYYGIKRFDEFQHYVGIAPNILGSRLKKLVDVGIMTRVPLPEHSSRHEYVLREGSRPLPNLFSAKKMGDNWLARVGRTPSFIQRSHERTGDQAFGDFVRSR
jgi:DNA-binding HxlR family transcriptional regulator